MERPCRAGARPHPQRYIRRVARIRFGEFELDPTTEELWRDGRALALRGHPVHILVHLLARPGELVTRKELCARLWGTTLVADPDANLNAHVHRLRSALADSAESPRWIETLPGKGYRFIGSVSAGARAERGAPTRRWVYPLIAVGLLLSTAVSLILARGAAAPELVIHRLASEGAADARLAQVLTEGLRAHVGFTYPERLSIAEDVGRVRRALAVRSRYELRGSLRAKGALVRVAVRMAEVGSGRQLWSEVLECDVSHLAAIERKIVQRIGHQLDLDAGLAPPGRPALPSVPSARQRAEMAEREVARGRASAEAEAFDRAVAAALEALRADYALAAGHSALAWAELHRGDLARAERELRLAIALDPKDRRARERLAIVLARR